MIEGRAWNEPLTIGSPPAAREYGTGETFWFPGESVHRMDHQAGAVTIHVYSPPIRAIGHYDLQDGQLRRTPGPARPAVPIQRGTLRGCTRPLARARPATKCLPRQRVSVKMKSNSDPAGWPVAWSSMEPSAPAYRPVPPVMASLVVVPSSKKGP